MRLSAKISRLDRLVEELRASISVDPLLALSDRERRIVEKWRKMHTPLQQYELMIDSADPASVLLPSVCILESDSDSDAQNLYLKHLDIFNVAYGRKRRFQR